MERSSEVGAPAPGTRSTGWANTAGTDNGAVVCSAKTARLPQVANPACSPALRRSTDNNARCGSAVIAASTRSNRDAQSETSKFEKGCPAPTVLKNCWSPNPRKYNPKSPIGPKLVYVAVPGTPEKLRVSLPGTKLTTTRLPVWSGSRESPAPSTALTGKR